MLDKIHNYLQAFPIHDPEYTPVLMDLCIHTIKIYGFSVQGYNIVGKLKVNLNKLQPINDTLLSLLYQCHLYKLAHIFKSILRHHNYPIKAIHKPSIVPLSYDNDSCFVDVVLMALLSLPNLFIHYNLLYTKKKCKPVQKVLRDIASSIRGKGHISTCQAFRDLLPPQFASGQHDAGEVLFYLFDLLDLKGVKYTRKSGHKHIVTSTSEHDGSPIFEINPQTRDDLTLSTIHIEDTAVEGWTYPTRTETRTISHAEYLVFYVPRKLARGRSRTIVVPPKYLDVNPYTLYLSSIIIHTGNHYTLYLRIYKTWYFYDDTKADLVTIGNYDKLMDINIVKTNGTHYFYT